MQVGDDLRGERREREERGERGEREVKASVCPCLFPCRVSAVCVSGLEGSGDCITCMCLCILQHL